MKLLQLQLFMVVAAEEFLGVVLEELVEPEVAAAVVVLVVQEQHKMELLILVEVVDQDLQEIVVEVVVQV